MEIHNHGVLSPLALHAIHVKSRLCCLFVVVVTCPSLEPPTHGVLQGYSNIYGSTVYFQCIHGYAINGPAEIECQSDGEWSVGRNDMGAKCIGNSDMGLLQDT